MILTHGANSLARFVEIGGRRYPVVKIGNQLWMAENLKNQFSDILVNPPGTSNDPAMHFDSLENLEVYGGLYNYYAAEYVEQNKATLCPTGWHIPTNSDFSNLFNTIGGINNAPSVLRDSNWGGSDFYNFSLKPYGYYDGNYMLFGTASYLWSIDKSGNSAYHLDLKANSCDFLATYGILYWEFGIRLVKDIT